MLFVVSAKTEATSFDVSFVIAGIKEEFFSNSNAVFLADNLVFRMVNVSIKPFNSSTLSLIYLTYQFL